MSIYSSSLSQCCRFQPLEGAAGLVITSWQSARLRVEFPQRPRVTSTWRSSKSIFFIIWSPDECIKRILSLLKFIVWRHGKNEVKWRSLTPWDCGPLAVLSYPTPPSPTPALSVCGDARIYARVCVCVCVRRQRRSVIKTVSWTRPIVKSSPFTKRNK